MSTGEHVYTKEEIERMLRPEHAQHAEIELVPQDRGSQFEGYYRVNVHPAADPHATYITGLFMCDCGKVYSGTGGQFKRHRKKCSSQAQIVPSLPETAHPKETTKCEVVDRIGQFFAQTGIPMSRVEDTHWKTFLRDILALGRNMSPSTDCASFVPCRATLRANILTHCDEAFDSISSFVTEAVSSKSMNALIDFGRVHKDFMILKGTTIRVDESGDTPVWKLNVIPLSIFPTPNLSKTSTAISLMVEQSLERYGIASDDIESMAFTADGAANVRKFCDEHTAGYVRCLSHLTQILARRLTRPYEHSQLSKKDLETLQRYEALFTKCDDVVRLYKKDKELAEKLKLPLKSTVVTRWFTFFDAAASVFSSLNVLVGNASDMENPLSDIVLELNDPTQRQRWADIEPFLLQLKEINILSQRNDVQMHLVIPVMVSLLEEYGKLKDTTDEIGSLARSGIESVKRNIPDMHPFHYLAASLDPANKHPNTIQDVLDENQIPIDVGSEIRQALAKLESLLELSTDPPTRTSTPQIAPPNTPRLLKKILAPDSTSRTQETLYAEYTRYLSTPSHLPPCHFWPISQLIYPKLSKVAKKIFSIASSEADVERSFSSLKNLYTSTRKSLHLDLLEGLMLTAAVERVSIQ